MWRRFLPVFLSLMMVAGCLPAAFSADNGQLNFKIYAPEGPPPKDEILPKLQPEEASFDAPAQKPAQPNRASSTPSSGTTDDAQAAPTALEDEPSAATKAASEQSATTGADEKASQPKAETRTAGSNEEAGKKEQIASKVLQGYIRVVPSGTKIPIIMDTAVDSDTSQEGDEFSARTAEDLVIDGQMAVPAGSIIKGRIAQLNAPKALNRSGSVALKFDTVTTPDNRQIPIVANLVARGGVVHARRGLKDVAMDCGVVSLPTAAGLGIGLLAGNSSGSLGAGGGALIGAGIGVAVGAAILLSKKGKKVDVRPGDELKIELAEDLRMPMM